MRFQQVRRPGKRLLCVSLFFFSLIFFSPSSLSCQKQFQDLAEMLRNFLTSSSMKPRSWRVVCFCLFRHSACLSACPSVHLSICPSVHLCDELCTSLEVILCVYGSFSPVAPYPRTFASIRKAFCLNCIMCLGNHSFYLLMTYLAPVG